MIYGTPSRIVYYYLMMTGIDILNHYIKASVSRPLAILRLLLPSSPQCRTFFRFLFSRPVLHSSPVLSMAFSSFCSYFRPSSWTGKARGILGRKCQARIFIWPPAIWCSLCCPRLVRISTHSIWNLMNPSTDLDHLCNYVLQSHSRPSSRTYSIELCPVDVRTTRRRISRRFYRRYCHGVPTSAYLVLI